MKSATMPFYFRACGSHSGPLAVCLLILIHVLPVDSAALGDGPEDNLPDRVRPIPPTGLELDAATVEALTWRCTVIRTQWKTLLEKTNAESGASNTTKAQSELQRLQDLEAEVLVFPRAVELAIEFEQFYRPNDAQLASQLLDEANRRLALVTAGASWRDVVSLGDGSTQQLIVGGFRSRIDGSYQPYGLVIPPGLTRTDARPRRLDLWFHGRGEKLSEVAFLGSQQRSAGQYTPTDTFVLHPYGRYSNAFKFAGEVDVLEALEYVQSRLPVDPNRISVRGFSMGGAACWQFATHHADRWFAANPGAGFSETPEFLRFFQQEDVRRTAPPYQQKLWQWYDCPPWAGNLAACPTVAYSGEIDRQKQAADVMAAALDKVGIDLVHIIGPDTGHKIHPQSKVEIEERMAALAQCTSTDAPLEVNFSTVTLRYHKMHWINVQGLKEHWKPARVIATVKLPSTIQVTTTNITDVSLEFAPGQWPGAKHGKISLQIDGQSVSGPNVRSDHSWSFALSREGGRWQPSTPREGLRKKPGLQGPIDDAFMDPFLFVLPSNRCADPQIQQWLEAESVHAMLHWQKHFRGDVRVVLDKQLTDTQIAKNHLIVFGDPTSSLVIEKIAGDLPLRWDDQKIGIGNDEVPAAGHVPILIYPNPLNPERYVVINSGFTFREYDYLNNARQTPKLPDWALVDIRAGATMQLPGVVKAAGFFDEQWNTN